MNLPIIFEKNTKLILGDEYDAFIIALQTQPPTSIRVNTKIEYHPSDEPVTWCENAYYLNERPLFTADPLLHAGAYYVQEASSMFLYQAVKQHFPTANSVMDVCAAPGGKSTLLSQTLPTSSLLVSNEIIRSRAYILAENLIKWGNPNIVITNNNPKEIGELSGFFDAMVVDAPCSGEGMFRKDADAIKEWSEYNVTQCAQRQKEILTSVWDALKTDGILVYSTCTFNREENENNVQWIRDELGADVLKMDLQGNKNITESDLGYRFYPHKTRGEGFFMAVLRKTSATPNATKNKTTKKEGKQDVKSIVPPLALLQPEKWSIVTENNFIKAYDSNRLEDFKTLNSQLKCMHSGIVLGEMKGTSFIPATSVALSKMLDKTSVVSVEVDYKTAIAFLRSEAIQLPATERGYILVCYKGLGLGWVKNVGNRCNNLYPPEWRIRMEIKHS
jgi:16S rRNA C967 or C1407 C5-methylase (RsmB/RsmF family)/NOL1/NOP2/fmu family ribosome biogenesis protein